MTVKEQDGKTFAKTKNITEKQLGTANQIKRVHLDRKLLITSEGKQLSRREIENTIS